ncbi:hypothetical protein SNE40_022966 [Patella caerulea]|uniref:Uncharacterized protein n=1 Tax=Patella caerulea TaxID=87958 RepID=A0AAN8G1T3_PATCE
MENASRPEKERVFINKEEEALVVVIEECSKKHKSRPTADLVLLVACCVCNGLIVGYSYAMGVLFLEMKESLHSSRAETAMVQSITLGVMCGGGLISAFISSMIGNGNTLLLGSLVACLSIVSGFFVISTPVLIIVVGVIGGFGLCNVFVSIFIAVGQVFKDDYKLALAALNLSGGIAYFIFPYLNVLMMQSYGWRGEMLIHVGLLANCIPLGLYIKIRLPNERVMPSSRKHFFSNTYFQSHVSLWTDPLYVTFFICLILRSVPLGLVTYFMLDIAVYKGFNEVDGSLFLSGVGFGNIIGRVIILLTRSLIRLSPVKEYCIYCIFTGVMLIFLGLGTHYWLIMAFSAAFGLGYGMLSSTANIAVFAISGEHRYPTALGIFNTGIGVGFGIAGPIGGVIKDNVESYANILYGFSVISILSGLVLLPVSCLCGQKRQELPVEEDS